MRNRTAHASSTAIARRAAIKTVVVVLHPAARRGRKPSIHIERCSDSMSAEGKIAPREKREPVLLRARAKRKIYLFILFLSAGSSTGN
jgi:hypothetical protein